MAEWIFVVAAVVLLLLLPWLLHLARRRRRRDELDFNIVDEAIHHLDTEEEPWTVHVEVCVPGALDENRLRRAAELAAALHPMARSFQQRWRPWHTVYRWQIAERFPPSAEVVRFVTCKTAREVEQARDSFESTRVSISEPPPFRLLVARRAEGDTLMLNFNHAACDGVGTLRFMRSLARAYAGEEDRVPASGQARDLTRTTAPRSFRERWNRLTVLREALGNAVLAPPSRLAGDGGRAEAGFGFVLRSVEPEIVKRLVARKLAGGTVNDALLAIFHHAIGLWNEAHGAPAARIGTMMPINVRPAETWTEGVANVTYHVSISTTAESRRSVETAAAAIRQQTLSMKQQGTAAALREILFASPMLLLELKRRMPALLSLGGDRFVDTAVLSNVGLVGERLVFGDLGEATELWFSPPCRMPLGLGVGIATYLGRAFVAFRYRRALWDRDAATRFADLFEAELEAALNPT